MIGFTNFGVESRVFCLSEALQGISGCVRMRIPQGRGKRSDPMRHVIRDSLYIA